MSVGSNNLQEMENAVTKGAAKADAMPSLTGSTPGQTGTVEDLGGPTPQNYKSDDDSAKLKVPGTTLKQVKDIVNKGAKPADPMPAGMKEEDQVEGDVVAEDEVVTDEVVSEEETTTDEVVSEEETTETEEEVVAEEEETVEYSLEDDINALVEGEDLSEEFKEKAATVFEAAVKSKMRSEVERLSEAYQVEKDQEVEAFKEELTEKVDTYLNYVVDEWNKENELAIERGLKGEIAEDFISGLKQLFEDHYIDVPDEKYDVLEAQSEKIAELEERLNEEIGKNVEMSNSNSELVREQVIAEVSDDLADTEIEKFKSLTADVEFADEESFREKVSTIKESYFPKTQAESAGTYIDDEQGGTAQDVDTTDSMKRYMSAISRDHKASA